MAKRRTFTAAFKARVAKEAMRGDRTVQQIAARHSLHPNQVSQWKRKASEGPSRPDREARSQLEPARLRAICDPALSELAIYGRVGQRANRSTRHRSRWGGVMAAYDLPFGFTFTAAQQLFLTNFWQPNFLFGSAPP